MTPGTAMVPSKRKCSPATSTRSPKSNKMESSPEYVPPYDIEVIDLISDDDEPSSSVPTTSSALSEKKSVGEIDTGRTSPINGFIKPTNSDIVPGSTKQNNLSSKHHSDLSKLRDDDLYSMFLNDDRRSAKANEERDDSSPEILFGQAKPPPLLPVTQRDPPTAASVDSAKVKEYREKSELGALKTSKALREAALLKSRESMAPQANSLSVFRDNKLFVPQNRKPPVLPQRTIPAIQKETLVNREETKPLQQPKKLPTFPQRVLPLSQQSPSSTLQSNSTTMRQERNDLLSPQKAASTLSNDKPLSLEKNISAFQYSETGAPQPQRVFQPKPLTEAQLVRQRARVEHESSAVSRNVIELTDETCREDSTTLSRPDAVHPIPQPSGVAAAGNPSKQPVDLERDKDLMKLIMDNENSKQKHAKVLSRPLPVPYEPSIPPSKHPYKDATAHRQPSGIDRLLGNNTSGFQRLADAQKARSAQLPPSRSATSTDILHGEHLFPWIDPVHDLGDLGDRDIKSINERRMCWEAVAAAAKHTARCVENQGLQSENLDFDRIFKEIREIRDMSATLASTRILNITEKKRMQDIGQNMKKRDERYAYRLAQDIYAQSNSVGRSKSQTAHVDTIISSLLDLVGAAERNLAQLQKMKVEVMEADRIAKLGARREQKRAKRANGLDHKITSIQNQLRTYKNFELRKKQLNSLEGESEEEESERDASPDSSFSVIGDEDDDFIRVPKATAQQDERATTGSRPPGSRPLVGGKGLSERTLELFRQEQTANGRLFEDDAALLKAFQNHQINTSQTEKVTTRPTTGGKTITLEVLQSWQENAAEAAKHEDEEDSGGEYEDLWMYQVHVTEYGGPHGAGGTKDYRGSYWTLDEANRQAAVAWVDIRTTPKERLAMESRVSWPNGIFSQTITYGSTRSIHITVSRVPAKVRDAGLRPSDYRFPESVWIVQQKVFYHPTLTTDDLFEEQPAREAVQTLPGVFTTQTLANEAASNCMVEALVERSGRKRDEVYRADVELKARRYLKELEDSGTLFGSTEESRGSGREKIMVWVVEEDLKGPRN